VSILASTGTESTGQQGDCRDSAGTGIDSWPAIDMDHALLGLGNRAGTGSVTTVSPVRPPGCRGRAGGCSVSCFSSLIRSRRALARALEPATNRPRVRVVSGGWPSRSATDIASISKPIDGVPSPGDNEWKLTPADQVSVPKMIAIVAVGRCIAVRMFEHGR
jgi:hypothetical protein